jgi:maleamate amidohydrolase
MEDLFGEAGYGGRPIGFGGRPAVLVVDFQKAVTDSSSPMGRSPMVQSAVESTARLLGEAREAGLPVVSCVTAYRPDFKDKPAWKATSVDDWTEGSWLTEIDERVWHEGDVLVTKKAPSIFFGTPVASILNREGVDTVIVTGANTSGCIRATVIDSFSYGFRTIVPRECVGDQGEEPHEANLLDIDRRYADVLPLEEVLSEVGRVASLSQSL